MTYTALTSGEHPPGLHWTEGETRDLDPEQAAGVPAWLEASAPPVEAPEPKEGPVAADGAAGA